MILVKKGYWHFEYGTNCQDAATEFDILDGNIKCITDGCSGSSSSEVGAQLFCFLLEKNAGSALTSFSEINELFKTPKDLLKFALFTTLLVDHHHGDFDVDTIGDGYIILQDHNDKITYERLDYGPAPPYYAYNYFPKDKLSEYKDGVKFVRRTYTETDYKAVGVASDGLQYILVSDHREEFERLLVARKLVQLKRFINKYSVEFKDDISIAI